MKTRKYEIKVKPNKEQYAKIKKNAKVVGFTLPEYLLYLGFNTELEVKEIENKNRLTKAEWEKIKKAFENQEPFTKKSREGFDELYFKTNSEAYKLINKHYTEFCAFFYTRLWELIQNETKKKGI